jgi:hypothetical protein
MRQMISGLVAALAAIIAGAAPAKACDMGCAPCGYVSTCGAYVLPYAGYERLPNPEVQYHHPVVPPQYYYVEQGPTYTGPGDFAPRRVYREEGIYGWGYHHRWRHHYWHHHYHQHVLHSYY